MDVDLLTLFIYKGAWALKVLRVRPTNILYTPLDITPLYSICDARGAGLCRPARCSWEA